MYYYRDEDVEDVAAVGVEEGVVSINDADIIDYLIDWVPVPNLLPDGYGRVFHHRVFLHQIIADLVIFHMSNRRLEENGYDTLPLITDAEAPCSIDSDPDDKENEDEDEDGEDGEDDEDEDNNDEEEEEEPKLDTPDTSKNDKKCYNSDQKSGYGKIEAAAESFCKSNLETNKDGPVFSNFRQTDKKTPPRSHHFIGTFEVFEGCEWEYSFDDCMRYFKAPVDRQL